MISRATDPKSRVLQTPRWVSLLILLLGFVLVWRLPVDDQPRLFTTTDSALVTGPGSVPLFEQHAISRGSTKLVHAASVVPLPDGRLFATWFGGAREGATNVKIYGSYYDSLSGWSVPWPIVTAEETQRSLYRLVRKLGNPVVTVGPDQRLWLFYVSVSIGGWAGSSVNLVISDDFGKSWGQPKRLITSPFMNFSTLVKGAPVWYQDGTLLLPVYHEFAGKFGELLHLDEQGKVLGKHRLDTGRRSLQPVLFVDNEQDASVLMRYAGKNYPGTSMLSRTGNIGSYWQQPVVSTLPNSNSALTGVSTPYGWLAVLNFNPDGREELSLVISQDQGETWTLLYQFHNQLQWHEYGQPQLEYEQLIDESLSSLPVEYKQQVFNHVMANQCGKDGCQHRYDYPYMVQDEKGEFHVLYTWNRSLVKHLRFNESWLIAQMQLAGLSETAE